MADSCATCRFGRLPNQVSIQCRRHAPRFVPPGQTLQVPTMPLDFWCGEFEPAPVADKPAPSARRPKAGH